MHTGMSIEGSAGTAAVLELEANASAHEYLTFRLGEEEYAVDILAVQEIRGYDRPTTIANAPDFLKGVINLRGVVVPIVDLRIKFSVGTVEYTEFTVVVILAICDRLIGIVVDGVSDVISLRNDQLLPAPDFSSSVGTQHIRGLSTLDDRMLIVTDIERLMISPEMALVNPAQSAASAMPL